MATYQRLAFFFLTALFLLTLLLVVSRYASNGNGREGGMVYIPAGEFVMGSSDEGNEAIRNVFGTKTSFEQPQPERMVHLEGFYLDKHEVTNREYKKFVDETGYRRIPDHWDLGKITPGEEDEPVTFVSWYDVRAYAKWAGKRLPTEEEWEKAARGTDGRRFPWGMEFDKSKANTWERWGGDTGRVGRVGRYEEGRSPYGVYDMAGNVTEWTGTAIKRYTRSHDTHKQEETLPLVIVRGGAWSSNSTDVRTSSRAVSEPYVRSNGVGFRCAK